MELDCVEIYQAEVWKIISFEYLKLPEVNLEL